MYTPLDETDVGAVQAAVQSELLLRNAALLADLPQGIAESALWPFEGLNVPLLARRALSLRQQNNAAPESDNSPTDNSRNMELGNRAGPREAWFDFLRRRNGYGTVHGALP